MENLRTKILAGVVVVGLIFSLTMIGQIIETVQADEMVVIQSPLTGELTWYNTPGPKAQLFGRVTRYKKRGIYEFTQKIRFNDGAHGTMVGSIQYELPTDATSLTALHVRFGNQDSISGQLLQKVVDKSIYMTGPLMSSKESYAERRNALISYIEDQVENGVYRTSQKELREKDPITGQEKTTTVVTIDTDKATGQPARAEAAVLAGFGIKSFNLAISSLDYEDKVEAQIQAQQQAKMDVETAMAESRKAEQRALTAAAEGEANAARAKWEQETVKAAAVVVAQRDKEVAETAANREKAVAVTAANRDLQVAELRAKEAEQYRLMKLKEAEGDATYKRQVLEADGALAQKLATYEKVQQFWANAYSQRAVPAMVFGSDGAGGGTDTGTNDFMNLMKANAAKDLAFDMGMKRQ